jgi:glycosyltransferase involved in cell wall biosynthesis
MATARSSGAPRVLAVLPQLIPSTLIGVVKPLAALHRERRIHLDVTFETSRSRRRLCQADVVVFCRNTEPRYGSWLDAALGLGRPIIYELDDNFFAIPSDTPQGRYHRDIARLALLERYLREASVVRVYSEALRARIAPLNPRVSRVRGLIDWDLVSSVPPRLSPPVRIVYATSRVTDTLAEMFVPDLCRVLDAFHGRVQAWFLGHRPPDLVARPDVHHARFVPDYDVFFGEFTRAGFDIGVAPLLEDEFHRSKSDNKFREYAAARIAGIYSDVEVYRDCVTHGQTGLLVPRVPGAWFEAMARLVEDEALRTKIQDEAWTEARSRYSVQRSAEDWLSHLDIALRTPRRAMTPAVSAGGLSVSLKSRARTAIRRARAVLEGRVALGAGIRRRMDSARALAKLRRQLAQPAASDPRR